MTHKILIVDDEVSICDLLKINLEAEGYNVRYSNDGIEALQKIEDFKPDLLILDLMLPGMNGLEICKTVTSKRPIPIIMLTAKSDLVDKILGLELGADDYITKPFHVREILARVKALLRRISVQAIENTSDKVSNGSLEIYTIERKVVFNGLEVDLSAKEYDLLNFLNNHLEHVLSREVLLEKVWGYDYAGDTRTVDVHIQRLRKKLNEEQAGNGLIQTIFGVGYKMKRQV